MQPMTELEADRLRRYYRTFARVEAADTSPVYAEWAQGVADDGAIIDLLLGLPQPKRQANLLFAAARHLGSGTGTFAQLRAWLLEHWDATRALMLERSTQTNEAGRCAVLLPELARLDGPLTLIEVGASAGLCLYPDRCSYRFTVTEEAGHPEIADRAASAESEPVFESSGSESGRAVRLDPKNGPSPVILECELSNASAPGHVPEVSWRGGIDLNPLDISDPDQREWLTSLIWPEHESRRARPLAATSVAAADPPHLIRGDLLETIESLLSEVPPDTQPVVFHTAMLAYVDPEAQEKFAAIIRSRDDVVWISNEGAGILPDNGAQINHGTGGLSAEDRSAESVSAGSRSADGRFVLAVDGTAIALTGPHGQSYEGIASHL
jgi:hypothetical protein